MSKKERVREEIQQIIGSRLLELLERLGCAEGCIHQEIKGLDMLEEASDQILAIPGLEVRAADQSLPEGVPR